MSNNLQAPFLHRIAQFQESLSSLRGELARKISTGKISSRDRLMLSIQIFSYEFGIYQNHLEMSSVLPSRALQELYNASVVLLGEFEHLVPITYGVDFDESKELRKSKSIPFDKELNYLKTLAFYFDTLRFYAKGNRIESVVDENFVKFKWFAYNTTDFLKLGAMNDPVLADFPFVKRYYLFMEHLLKESYSKNRKYYDMTKKKPYLYNCSNDINAIILLARVLEMRDAANKYAKQKEVLEDLLNN